MTVSGLVKLMVAIFILKLCYLLVLCDVVGLRATFSNV